MFFGAGDPNRPDATYHHAIKIRELIERNKTDGPNQMFLSRACLIFIYSTWDGLRPLLAELVGREQNRIRSDIFGDLRLYRNAIVHNDAILDRNTSVLSFIAVGEVVQLKQKQMNELFELLFDEVNRISVEFTGNQLDRKFARRLNQK